jgi:two-component system chemotaxis sensor kinase CheA
MTLRGESLPFIRLRSLLGLKSCKQRENVVIVGYQGGHAGMVVDTLYGEHQTVIKPLGNLFQNLPGISGSTILGDGRIALVLDVPGLYREMLGKEPRNMATASN